MDVLWSPWRSKYIDTFKGEDKNGNVSCFLCDAAQSDEKSDKELLIITRRSNCFALLNKFPYNNGHVLIAPCRHVGDMEELTDDELSGLMFLIRDTIKALNEAYSPHGYNAGINLGRTAGAGVPGHLHFHVVPRWNGDTSFMAVLSDVKVVSQSLEDTRDILSGIFNRLNKK